MLDSFGEIASSKTAERTVKHLSGGGDSVIAKHHCVGGNFDGCNNTNTALGRILKKRNVPAVQLVELQHFLLGLGKVKCGQVMMM